MVECKKFTPYKKGNLQGFADLYVDKWGVTIYGCSLFKKEGKRWINFPSKEYEEEGEKKFIPMMNFESKHHQFAFSEKAKQAIDQFILKEKQNRSVDEGNSP